MGFYDKYILPHFLNCACGSKPIVYQREKVVPMAEGLVLEVGIGSGLNIPFYDSTKVDKILGLDPSEELNRMALKVAADKGIPVEFILGGAEAIPLPDNHVDTVLVTYTMCTIPEVAAANKEILRVLKPQGKMIFCEHGLAPDANISKWQNRIDPYWGKIAGGCHINRDIRGLLDSSSLVVSEWQSMYLPQTPRVAGYNVWGRATLR